MNWRPLGLSAQAIAGLGTDHPWDPSDLRRCVDYCRTNGITTDRLRKRMSGRSESWNRLLPEWDNLVALMQHEIDTRTDNTAPLTYREMKRVLADGLKCNTCGGTGRGADCDKCKGSGYRGGGRCRADGCHRGARRCPGCSGAGYIKKGKP